MTEKWDIVIVGGGLAGYVAANYLSNTGLSILLLEKGKNVGGRAQTTKMKQQYFNLGPHALYKKGKALMILEEIGIELNGSSPNLDCLLIENQMEYTAPFTPRGLYSTKLLSWKEKMEWITLLMKILRITPEELAELTLEQWIKQVTPSSKVQALLSILGRLSTYCHAPEKVSAKLVVSYLKTVMGGVLYLDDGWQTIIDQLHNRAIISGVQVQTHATVKRLIRGERDEVKLILSKGKEILAKKVICTTSPKELSKIANLPQNDFFTNSIPVTGATFDVALSQLPRPERLLAMGLSDPLYFSVHSQYARLSKNEDSAILHVFKYHHPDEQINEDKEKTELEQFLDKIQPGWQNHLIASRYIPKITVSQRLPQPSDEAQLLRYETAFPGLYIAGDWASPGAILAEGAVCSGLKAAKEIIKEEMR